MCVNQIIICHIRKFPLVDIFLISLDSYPNRQVEFYKYYKGLKLITVLP